MRRAAPRGRAPPWRAGAARPCGLGGCRRRAPRRAAGLPIWTAPWGAGSGGRSGACLRAGHGPSNWVRLYCTHALLFPSLAAAGARRTCRRAGGAGSSASRLSYRVTTLARGTAPPAVPLPTWEASGARGVLAPTASHSAADDHQERWQQRNPAGSQGVAVDEATRRWQGLGQGGAGVAAGGL